MPSTRTHIRRQRRSLLARTTAVPITALSVGLLAAGLAGCEDNNPTGTESEPTAASASTAAGTEPSAETAVTAAGDVHAQGTIPLPIFQSFSGGTAFQLFQFGSNGQAGRFKISESSNSGAALVGETVGPGVGLEGKLTGQGLAGVRGTADASGSAGFFHIANTSNGSPALRALHQGRGPAGFFEVSNGSNTGPALEVSTLGRGSALTAHSRGLGTTATFEQSNQSSIAATISAVSLGQGITLGAENKGIGRAAQFSITNTSNFADVVDINNRGQGAGLRVDGLDPGSDGVLISTRPGAAGLQVVGGSKNAVVHTPGGSRALYTEESTEVWFTDYGFGRLQNGRARVLLDPAFAQTIATDEPYHVFLQARGRAELYVGESTPLGFTVELKDGDPNAEFSYRVVAKRLGFEGKRLEPALWVDQLDHGLEQDP